MKYLKAALFVVLLTCGNGWGSVVWADEDSDRSATDMYSAKSQDLIKSRSYFGVMGTSSTIDQRGDFNGINAMQFGPVTFTTTQGVTGFTNPEVDLIPAIDRNFGWGVMLGHREGPWAAEISFWRSDHNATFTGGTAVTFTTPANFQSIDFDFKRYFLTQLPTQPYISLGVCFPWLWVHQASYILDYQDPPNATTGQYNILSINDESISGFGFRLGAGLEIYLGNYFSLAGGAFERWTGFTQINGAEKMGINNMYFDNNPSDRGSLEGDGLNFYIAATVGLQ